MFDRFVDMLQDFLDLDSDSKETKEEKEQAFQDLKDNLDNLDITASKLDEICESLDGMFLDLDNESDFQMNEVTNFAYDFMFLRCKSLEEIRFTFSIEECNIVRLKGLFVGCDSLKLVDVSQLYLYRQKYTCEGIFFDMSNREEGHGGRIIIGHNDVTELVDDSVSGETIKVENKLILKGKVEITDSSKIARHSMLNNQYYTL